MVIPVAAPETLGAYQISVVVPLAFVAWDTCDQLAPVWVIEEIRFDDVPRVEITAIRVFPSVGADVRVTEKEVAAVPVFPEAL